MSGILGLVLGNFAPAAGGGVTVIQSFTATGDWVCPTGVTEVEWLIVAGGGGGGLSGGGGGGAGGYRTGTGHFCYRRNYLHNHSRCWRPSRN
jgi:hypothetical protein